MGNPISRAICPADITKVTRWHAETHLFAVVGGAGKVTFKIVDDLREDTTPVNGLTVPRLYLALNSASCCRAFYDILAVIEHTFDGDVMDIFVIEAIHLCALELTHFAMG